MRKRLLAIAAFALLMMLSVVLAACVENETPPPVQYTLTYTALEGGYIKGNEIQIVNEGENALEVTATPFAGYTFVKWSDNNTNPVRTDTNVTSNKTLTATFAKIVLTANYKSDISDSPHEQKGYIVGELSQSVAFGDFATAVTAVPFAGNLFSSWSDGVTTATRQDINVKADIDVYAIFVVGTKQLRYEYNGATANNSTHQVTLALNSLDETVLVIPEKTGYKFSGWYLDSLFTQKAANYAGQLLLNEELFLSSSTTLYAKWTTEETLTYPILMVFATEFQATLPTADGVEIDVDYKMSDWERQLCNLIVFHFERYLNEIFDGLVVFEVDFYFTTEILGEENISKGFNWLWELTYDIYADGIPETFRLLPKYRSVITTFGMNDFNSLLRTGGGSGGAKYASVYMETLINFAKLKGIENKSWNSISLSNSDWVDFMYTHVHEFTHTVELTISWAWGDVYDYHETIWYYQKRGIWDVESTELYLLNEAVINGEKVGIPLWFWKGEMNVWAVYVINDFGFGKLTCTNSEYIFSDQTVSQRLSFGETSFAVTAIPNEGYRFIGWSDGVQTATRQDTNIISSFQVVALFERIE